MTRSTPFAPAAVLTLFFAAAAHAGLPLPDVIAYGRVCLNGTSVKATDPNVWIIARVGGPTGGIVGSYLMGTRVAAGDRYVLRIRLESLADGSAPSADAARIGSTVQIYVRSGAGPEQLGGSLTVAAMGTVVLAPLTVGTSCPSLGDVDNDGDVDAADSTLLILAVNGPDKTTPPPGVSAAVFDRADLDNDNDVDMRDVALFQELFSTGGN